VPPNSSFAPSRRLVDQAKHAALRFVRHEWPHVGCRVERIAGPEGGLALLDEPMHEVVVDLAVDEQSRARRCRPRPCSNRCPCRRQSPRGSRSATSAMNTCGDLPPHSSATRFMFDCPAYCRISLPTSVEPVNVIFATSGMQRERPAGDLAESR
jgi:hypothetical protein